MMDESRPWKRYDPPAPDAEPRTPYQIIGDMIFERVMKEQLRLAFERGSGSDNSSGLLQALESPQALAKAREIMRVRRLLDALIFDIRARCATAIYRVPYAQQAG